MNNLVDLHTHSLFSKHAYSSVTENIEEAYNVGLKYYGITDHQFDHINFGADRQCFQNLEVVPSNYKGMHVLKGMEANVGEYFHEYVDFIDKYLDYAVASIHGYIYSSNHTIEENTIYYLQAIKTPKVKILGHADDGTFLSDYYEVIKACKENKVLVELNNSSIKPNGFRKNAYENMSTMIKICKELNCPVVMDSDAHIKYDIGRCERVYELAKDLGLKEDLIANINTDIIEDYFNI